MFEEEQFELQNSDFSSKVFFAQRDDQSLQQQNTTRTQVKKGIQRTPPYLTYIRDSIDQGATRLGGL